MEKEPIIMLGCQRSGTTHLARLLQNQPHSAFTSEGSAIWYLIIWGMNLCKEWPDVSNFKLKEFANAVQMNTRANKTPRQKELIDKGLQQLSRIVVDKEFWPFSENGDVSVFFRKIAFQMHKSLCESMVFWGDKLPEYLFHIEDLIRLFPKAKFIFVRRHPYSVIEALYRRIFSKDELPGQLRFCFQDCVDQYLVWNEKWLTTKEIIPEKSRFEISYESYVTSPDQTISEMFEFMNVKMNTKTFLNWKNRLEKGNLDKWENTKIAPKLRDLGKNERIRNVAGRLGYEL